MRRILVVLLLCVPLRAMARDVLSVGSGGMQVPVTIGKNTASPVQGVAFKLLFDEEAISAMSFARTGTFAAETPLYEQALQGSGWFSYVVLFATPVNVSGQLGVLTATSSLPPGSVVPLTLHPPSAMLSNQAASAVETVENGQLELVNGSLTVSAPATPAGLTATALNTSRVHVGWNAVAGATHYEVWRSVDGGAFALIRSPSATAIEDATVLAGKSWLYRVRAFNGPHGSPFSDIDAATTIFFTDDPLLQQSTRVKAVHLTQLRTAVNAMRASASLPPLSADVTIGAGLRVRAQHILALRDGLNDARAAIGLPALSFTDATLTVIKAVHVQELRGAVK